MVISHSSPSKQGRHNRSESLGEQKTDGSLRLTRQHDSKVGLVHCKKSSIHDAGGLAKKDDSGRLRSASRELATESSMQVVNRPQSCC